MKKERRVPIFFACDENFVKYTVVALESMIANASTERKYIIHVLNTDISENMKQVLYHMANDNFEIQFNNVTNYLRTIHEKLPIRDYYSHTTYYRFFIAEMFPEYEKAIYIDSDTIVKGDISRLYDFDLGDNYVGGVNDQVVVQDPIFGDYVEKVLGVERNNYFNAGLLLINCDQFRKNNVLDQFCKLLHMYNFVVAQDQDYLNVICHNKVLWLPQVWNTEVFGEIAPKEEDICILHYNLAAKPWHYKDCRMQQYFWKYAERSGVYPEILKELETYTDEQRAEDMASGANLLELAKQEIAKENNLVNVADKPDSEDICFIPDGNYKKFLEENSTIKPRPGNIVLTDGTVLGKHTGLYNYTIGQRKGMGISYKEPLFVIGFNILKNEVIVGTKEEVYKKEAIINNINILIKDIAIDNLKVGVKTRYSKKESIATLHTLENNKIKIIFNEPEKSLTPGQSAVFYLDDIVVGGGIIEQAL